MSLGMLPTFLAIAFALVACGGSPRQIEALSPKQVWPGGIAVRGVGDFRGGAVGAGTGIDSSELAVDAPRAVKLRVERGWLLARFRFDLPWEPVTDLRLATHDLAAVPGHSVKIRFAFVPIVLDHASEYACRFQIAVNGARREVDVPIEIMTALE
jgi:hypothetical protein